MFKRTISLVAVAAWVFGLSTWAGTPARGWSADDDAVISTDTTVTDPPDLNSLTVDSAATLDVTKALLTIDGRDPYSGKG